MFLQKKTIKLYSRAHGIARRVKRTIAVKSVSGWTIDLFQREAEEIRAGAPLP